MITVPTTSSSYGHLRQSGIYMGIYTRVSLSFLQLHAYKLAQVVSDSFAEATRLLVPYGNFPPEEHEALFSFTNLSSSSPTSCPVCPLREVV